MAAKYLSGYLCDILREPSLAAPDRYITSEIDQVNKLTKPEESVGITLSMKRDEQSAEVSPFSGLSLQKVETRRKQAKKGAQTRHHAAVCSHRQGREQKRMRINLFKTVQTNR